MTRLTRLGILLIAGTLISCTEPAQSPQNDSQAEGRNPLAGRSTAPAESIDGTSGSDWPQWRGSRQDGISRETGLFGNGSESPPEEIWRVDLGNGYSGMTVAGDRVYTMFGDDKGEYVVCLSTVDGETIWKVTSGDAYINTNGSGPRATPTIHEGLVYTVGASGDTLCLDATTGEKVWGLNVLDAFDGENLEWALSASPVVFEDKLIVVTNGSDGRSLAALDKITGETVWTSLDDRAGYSTPLIIEVDGETQIAVVTGEAVVGVAPADGTEFWRYPWETQLDVNAATPIFHDNRLFVSSGYDTGAALLDLASLNGGGEPELVWESRRMKNHFSSSVLWDGFLYGFHNAILTCLDFTDGETQWSQRGFHKGSLLVADGKLIVFGERGNLALAEPSPEEFNAIWEIDSVVEGNRNWTVPTMSHGRLYVRNEEELVCFDLRS